MTITATPVTSTTTTTQTTRRALWRPAAAAGVAAAVATATVAAVADAAGASLAVDGEPIPPLGFANLTLICVALGYVLALGVRRWAARPRRTFTITTIALTFVSFVPDLVVPAATGTRFVLMATHVVAALIVIPAIASRLSDDRR